MLIFKIDQRFLSNNPARLLEWDNDVTSIKQPYARKHYQQYRNKLIKYESYLWIHSHVRKKRLTRSNENI